MSVQNAPVVAEPGEGGAAHIFFLFYFWREAAPL